MHARAVNDRAVSYSENGRKRYLKKNTINNRGNQWSIRAPTGTKTREQISIEFNRFFAEVFRNSVRTHLGPLGHKIDAKFVLPIAKSRLKA